MSEISQERQIQLVDRLVKAGVDLAIIGGFAVNAHGFSRATEDIDIVFDRDNEAELRMLEVLQSVGAFYLSDEIDPSTSLEREVPVTLAFIKSRRLMMLCTDFGYIDVFDYVPGLPDAQVADLLASKVEYQNRPYANLDWLRRMKQASGRPSDLRDLENLPSA